MRRPAGFSLVEVMVAGAIFGVVMAASLGTTSVALKAFGEQQQRAALLGDASRALASIERDLRQSGHVAPNPPAIAESYPFFFSSGNAGGGNGTLAAHSHAPATLHAPPGNPANGPSREVIFLAPADLDGDGLPTSALTGKIEWGAAQCDYVVTTGPDGVNQLVRRVYDPAAGAFGRQQVLARRVERIVFDDATTDATLAPNALRVRIYLYTKDARGDAIEQSAESVILMRNVEEP